MNRIFILISLLLISQAAFAATNSNPQREAVNKIANSQRQYHETCLNIADNFRADHKFANYFRNKCLLFESDRARMVDAVFPVTNSAGNDYRQNYIIYKSDFITKVNDNELNNYKTIITEYCRYNSFRFNKKDSNACSPERINGLFN